MDKEFEESIKSIQNEILKQYKIIYSKKVIDYSNNPRNVGRMNDPDGSAYIKGICGDTMEIYFTLKDDKIDNIVFFTDGCGATLACGSAVTEIAKNKTILESLKISPADIIEHLNELPEENLHCSILAVSTFHKAIAEYLLKK